MIQATVARLVGLVDDARILVLTNQKLVERVRRQLPQLPAEHVMGEPCARDTAPCIGLAAFWLLREDVDATMVVLPADHMIRPDDRFRQAIGHACRLVANHPDALVTFGIRPTYPAESFGYIERGEALDGRTGNGSAIPTYHVRRFHEKPTAAVARRYLEGGRFYWNSGIFVWRAGTILDQLARHEPIMYAHLQSIASAFETAEFEAVLTAEFSAIDGRSIDYAVMENAESALVVEAPFDWDDVGSWQSLARLNPTDNDQNTITGRHLGIDTSGCIIRSEGDHLIVTLGVRDCIVVHTPDATLVADKSSEEQVREVVRQLKERGWTRHL
jgi:mannose-1-phosphate guanylyltransferase